MAKGFDLGLDSWTRSPIERHYAAKPPPEQRSLGDKLRDKAKDLRDGTKRCGCGCGKTGTAFRGGKLYNPACVGPKWAKAGLPIDRTPPPRYGGKRWVPND